MSFGSLQSSIELVCKKKKKKKEDKSMRADMDSRRQVARNILASQAYLGTEHSSWVQRASVLRIKERLLADQEGVAASI